MGAKHIYFDRAFSSGHTRKDRAMIEALRNSHGKVSFGATSKLGQSIKCLHRRPKVTSAPHPAFRTMVGMSVLNGWAKPFALSAEFPYALNIAGQKLNSISSNIAGVDGAPTDFYRPDWSIRDDHDPDGQHDRRDRQDRAHRRVRGKDDLGRPRPNTMTSTASRARAGAGVYFHAVGAQTLREGTPRNWGWIPALVVAALFSLVHVRCRSRRTAALNLVAAMRCTVAFIFDVWFITADFLPPYLLFGIVAYRSMMLREINAAHRPMPARCCPICRRCAKRPKPAPCRWWPCASAITRRSAPASPRRSTPI
jgi:hypothetical protein